MIKGLAYVIHYTDVIMARLRLKSPALRLFTQPFIQAQIKENIKAPRHWSLWGEFTGDRWIPRTNGQYRGKCFQLMTSSCFQTYEKLASIRWIRSAHSKTELAKKTVDKLFPISWKKGANPSWATTPPIRSKLLGCAIFLSEGCTLYEEFCARNRYLGHGKVITSHRILWDVITYPCPIYLLLVQNSRHQPEHRRARPARECRMWEFNVSKWRKMCKWPWPTFPVMVWRLSLLSIFNHCLNKCWLIVDNFRNTFQNYC